MAIPAVVLLCAPPAEARRPKKPPVVETVAPPPAPTAEAPAPPPVQKLFPSGLPAELGPTPAGLANVSAQGCAACHVDAHEGWAASGHHQTATPAFLAATADLPACQGCHLPLDVQHAAIAHSPGGDPFRTESIDNPAWSPTLQGEGVTCAACHVREGAVLSARDNARAPHPVRRAPELEGAVCASCHQLSWPGADLPFYDTVGEWQRSAYAQAGVGCLDCHLRDDPSQKGIVSHGIDLPKGRALSLIVESAPRKLVRGEPGGSAIVTLANTGAGHAFPTGTPFKGVELVVHLVGPPDKKGKPIEASRFSAPIGRTVDDAPPFKTTADNRLLPGELRRYDVPLSLPRDALPGPWILELTLVETLSGKPIGDPFVVQTVALSVF